jgi:ClpP class serine protease
MKLIDCLSAPWAIQPAALLDIQRIVACHMAGEQIDIGAVEARIGRPLSNTRQVTLRGSTALIPVTGPIFRYANMMTDISGATSLQVLATDFASARDNPSVENIVLVMDTPGGQASGIGELAQMIRESDTPVTAYIDNAASSAGYWLAAAAHRIVMAKSATVGSIGAVISIDTTKRGDHVEIVSSQSPNKRVDATTDAGRSELQSLIDGLAQVFIDDVATYRATSPANVIENYGRGGVVLAAEAKARGMVDEIGTLEGLLAKLDGTATNQPSGATRMNQKTAAVEAQEPAAQITIDSLRASYPQLVADLIAEGAKAERDRIASVEAQLLPGHEALIASLKADGISTGGDAAIQILAAEKARRTAHAQSLYADAPKPVPHAAAPATEGAAATPDENLPIETRCAQQWESNAGLRDEFATLDAFIAYERATAKGLAKTFRK